jgi:hypothetical protein
MCLSGTVLELLDPEGEDTMVLWNVSHCTRWHDLTFHMPWIFRIIVLKIPSHDDVSHLVSFTIGTASIVSCFEWKLKCSITRTGSVQLERIRKALSVRTNSGQVSLTLLHVDRDWCSFQNIVSNVGQWTVPNSEWFGIVTTVKKSQLKKTWFAAAVLSLVPGKIAYRSPCNSHFLSFLSVCEFEDVINFFKLETFSSIFVSICSLWIT